MSTNREQLDEAIDRVAARMVAVADDPEMAARIASGLPHRSSRLRWLIPQFAALSVLALAAVWWSMREQPPAPAVLSSTEIAAVAAFPGVTPREPGTPRTPRTQPLEPSEPLEPLEPDFDRSLPALNIAALPAIEALTLTAIDIGELPLAADTTSPDKF